MRAIRLEQQAAIDTAPLRSVELPVPEPGPREIRVRVAVCGICRTDLHVVEGELPPQRAPVVPGHQVVGVVDRLGAACTRFAVGDRVGIAWLRATCGSCRYCRAGNENLCRGARFTGYHADGGYAEYAVVREDFAYAMPAGARRRRGDAAAVRRHHRLPRAAPRRHPRRGVAWASTASARRRTSPSRSRATCGCTVYVMTRDERAPAAGARARRGVGRRRRRRCRRSRSTAPCCSPPSASSCRRRCEALDNGGTLALAGIYLSRHPGAELRAPPVSREDPAQRHRQHAAATARSCCAIAAEIPIRPHTTAFPLGEANRALQQLKHDGIHGSGVLVVAG